MCVAALHGEIDVGTKRRCFGKIGRCMSERGLWWSSRWVTAWSEVVLREPAMAVAMVAWWSTTTVSSALAKSTVVAPTKTKAGVAGACGGSGGSEDCGGVVGAGTGTAAGVEVEGDGVACGGG